ncbi:MAG: 2-dehydropantoate 2-reductase [Deinococcales bacterium]
MSDSASDLPGGPPLLVWGAGAIGGTVAAHLARAGVDVTVVDANAAHVEAIRRHGLEITGPVEAFSQPLRAFTPAEVSGVWATVFLCTKALDTAVAARALLPHLADDGVVVSLQNGLNELTIAEVAGRGRALGAFVNFGADVLEPGVVHFGGRGAVVVGELDGRESARSERVLTLLRHFEPDAIVSDNIWGYLWGKMGYGVLLFAGALTDASIVDTLDAPDVRAPLAELAREVMRVAAEEGVTPMGFNGFEPTAFLAGASDASIDASFAAMVAFNRGSAKTHSGVWRDIAVHHRKTETDAQFNPILAIAHARGVPVPLLERLVAAMHEIEAGERPLAWANLVGLAASGPTEGKHAHPL